MHEIHDLDTHAARSWTRGEGTLVLTGAHAQACRRAADKLNALADELDRRRDLKNP